MGRVAQTPLAAVGLLTPAPRSAATTAHPHEPLIEGKASPDERSPCSWNRFACGRCTPAPRVTMSLKVLQRAGFAIIGTEISFANGRNKEIEETILRLDEPAKGAPSDAASRAQTY